MQITINLPPASFVFVALLQISINHSGNLPGNLLRQFRPWQYQHDMLQSCHDGLNPVSDTKQLILVESMRIMLEITDTFLPYWHI
jgi:hypothetical protein